MSRPITVSILGGVGNQFFRYYAGFALATLRRTELVLDDTWHAHGVSIREFDLPGRWVGADESRFPRIVGRKGLFHRAFAKAVRSSTKLSRWLHFYGSNTEGYDGELFLQAAGTKVNSLSASYRSVIEAVDLGAPVRPALLRESEWLRGKRAEAERIRPIMAHVRRGDYPRANFGWLDGDYYRRALAHLDSIGIVRPLWVFSDQPGAIPEVLAERGQLISSPQGAAEDLVLMGYGSATITANSTFSWWGAWFNSTDAPTIFPSPRWRARSGRSDLEPPWWIPIASSWQ